jgi:hypothetical protein
LANLINNFKRHYFVQKQIWRKIKRPEQNTNYS